MVSAGPKISWSVEVRIFSEFNLNYDRCEARDGRQHSVWSLMRSISVNQVSALLCREKKRIKKGNLAGKWRPLIFTFFIGAIPILRQQKELDGWVGVENGQFFADFQYFIYVDKGGGRGPKKPKISSRNIGMVSSWKALFKNNKLASWQKRKHSKVGRYTQDHLNSIRSADVRV